MTWKAGALLLANASLIARLAGAPGAADLLAIIYIAAVTLYFERIRELPAAVRSVRS